LFLDQGGGMRLKEEDKVGLILVGVGLFMFNPFFRLLYSGFLLIVLGIFLMIHIRFGNLGSGLYFLSLGTFILFVSSFLARIVGIIFVIVGIFSLRRWLKTRKIKTPKLDKP
jgi:hypothetical protein